MSVSSEIPASELRSILETIELGEVALVPEGPTANEVFAGNVAYRASNGWRIVVFNDCGCWDYLDSAEAPDGRRAEYPSGLEPFTDELHELFTSYQPPVGVVRDIYGFR